MYLFPSLTIGVLGTMTSSGSFSRAKSAGRGDLAFMNISRALNLTI
jgi:hypothetical protein